MNHSKTAKTENSLVVKSCSLNISFWKPSGCGTHFIYMSAAFLVTNQLFQSNEMLSTLKICTMHLTMHLQHT